MSSPSDRDPAGVPPLANETQAQLGQFVDRAAVNQPIRCATLQKLAAEHGVPPAHIFAAAANATTVEFVREHKTAFVVCAGNCQEKGALDHLAYLLEKREPRLKAWFKKAFDVETRGCLNRCDHSPVVRVHTRDGVFYLDRATREDIDEAITATCR